MATFKVILTFDDLPNDNDHKELIKNEINNKICSVEHFTKQIFYNYKNGFKFENNKIKFKFYVDVDEEKMSLQKLKKWAEKNIRKSLLGKNKYYLDTYKVIKYKVFVKKNQKLLKLNKDYTIGYNKGGDDRKKSLKKYLKGKDKIQFGGSYKNYNKRTKKKSNKKLKRSKTRSNRRYNRRFKMIGDYPVNKNLIYVKI